MKRLNIILILLFIFNLTACSKPAAPAVFRLQADATASIHLVRQEEQITVDHIDVCQAIIAAVNNGNPIAEMNNVNNLPKQQYRFSLVDNSQQTLETITVFSNEYIQIGTTLYKGAFLDLINLLNKQFAPTELETIVKQFTDDTNHYIEMVLHHHKDNTYKILSAKKDMKAMYSRINRLKQAQEDIQEIGKPQYSVYVRTKGQDHYGEPLQILKTNKQTTLVYGDDYCAIQAVDWEEFFASLPYNIMP